MSGTHELRYFTCSRDLEDPLRRALQHLLAEVESLRELASQFDVQVEGYDLLGERVRKIESLLRAGDRERVETETLAILKAAALLYQEDIALEIPEPAAIRGAVRAKVMDPLDRVASFPVEPHAVLEDIRQSRGPQASGSTTSPPPKRTIGF